MVKCRINKCLCGIALSVFCSGAVLLYGTRSQENEIQLDFSQSSQRAKQHIFVHLHLFLHAEGNRQKAAALFSSADIFFQSFYD